MSNNKSSLIQLGQQMVDKFAEYYKTEKRQKELSQYVHENFKIIHLKMISEMSRKLNITPDLENPDGYVSLQISLIGRFFNELVYCLSGCCQAFNLKVTEIIPISTWDILLQLLKNKNPLNGNIRTDVEDNRETFQKMFEECIDDLRKCIEALPISE